MSPTACNVLAKKKRLSITVRTARPCLAEKAETKQPCAASRVFAMCRSSKLPYRFVSIRWHVDRSEHFIVH